MSTGKRLGAHAVEARVKLSLLDRSRTRVGYPDGAALAHTIERAVTAERLGYHRFWVAEHHAVPGIASASPPVLLAALGAHTTTIRIGSGGVMLPHHQPLVVAEQFLMLDALYPGRVDLGLGRSLGFTAPVRRALRHPSETFAEDVAEVRDHLDGTAAVTARPVTARTIPVFVLATGRGLAIASALGLPVVVGGPVLGSPSLADALAAYRKEFRPSARAPEPSVTVSLDVLVGETDAAARDLALPEAWAMARSRQTGEFGPLEPVAAIRAQRWTSQVRDRVEGYLAQGAVGSPATVRGHLGRLVEVTGAEEVLAFSSTYDREAQAASDAALREL
ncbi:MsnO8 family LLM class oxidoreductase [Promicromonospora sukumoe]|uniref:MsnO8 family LLM class oxidoreductase n=1 Tax=Promicromonospora sukumoe TaxID=88382 RepID=UPI000686EB31|nr:MsnO8 family LLM class oxidoreductase [Promicromonospora sukumoe]